ncbi:hypothetical protein Q5M85_11330 [Paraclostridium bifermentans]|nr:hypothetical protein [Paraclostridium bifermentans]
MDDGYMELIQEVTGLDNYHIYEKIQENPVSPIVELKVSKMNDNLKVDWKRKT